jgi:hypothetical protein
MAPTLVVGDSVTLDEDAVPSVDDVVVFENPVDDERSAHRISRVVAVGPADVDGGDGQTVELTEGSLWVLGDNRANSRDSTSFGPLRADAVIGVVDDVDRQGDDDACSP